MKSIHLSFILFVLIIIACKNSDTKPAIKEVVITSDSIYLKDASGPNNKEIEEITQDSSFYDLDYVKAHTRPFTDSIDVGQIDRNSLHKIPKVFLEKYISPIKVTNGYEDYLPSDFPELYEFYQFKEFNDFTIFTILYTNEFCCTMMYALTTSKDSLNVGSISTIAFTGGDGGWYGWRKGTWIDETTARLIDVSNYDENPEDAEELTEIDSLWIELKINHQGHLTEQILDSVSYRNGHGL